MTHDPDARRLQELEDEVEHLRRRTADLEEAKRRSAAATGDAERQLRMIHGSKMWRLWMLSINVRKALRRVIQWPARAVGAVYLGGYYLWQQLLARFRRARRTSSATAPDASVELGRRLRLLVVMPYHIVPPDHGGGTRLFNLCRELGARCDLHLLIFSRTGEDPEQRRALAPWCREIFFHHWAPEYQPDLFGLRPINPQFFMSSAVAQQIRQIVETCGIDAVQLEYAELGQYLDAVPPGVPVTLTEHDIAFESHRRRRALGLHERFAEGALHKSTLIDWLAFFRFEIRACHAADSVHTMSHRDAELLSAYLPDGAARLRVVPNGVDLAYYRSTTPAGSRRGVLFVGNFENHPNLDGIEFFVTQVWPLVRRQIPECRLRVVGAFADERLAHLDGHQGISVHGRTPDLRPEYHSHRVMVAPIRAGSGTRLKILEALASATPVVSTAIGVEGLDASHESHCLIADEPSELAKSVVRVLTDDALAERLAAAGEALVAARYDWGTIAERIVRAHVSLVASSHSMALATPLTSSSPKPMDAA